MVEAVKVMNQTMGSCVIANSQDKEGFELRPVLRGVAKTIPSEKE